VGLGICRSTDRALATFLLRQDHVYSTTDESFRFHNNKFDEMRCKLDSTENPRSFEKHPTPPQGFRFELFEGTLMVEGFRDWV